MPRYASQQIWLPMDAPAAGSTRDYRLGPFAFHLKHAIETQIRLDELDETVVLTVWGSHGPTVLRVEESSDPVIMTMKVGATLPLMHSAAGRIFAAFMPRRIIDSYLQVANFSAAVHNGRSSIRYDDMEPELADIRRSGLSVSNGEVLRGISAVAGPLLAPQGQLIGVLAVIGQQDSLDCRPMATPRACCTVQSPPTSGRPRSAPPTAPGRCPRRNGDNT